MAALVTLPLAAQQGRPAQQRAPRVQNPMEYEREVYSYPGESRRDPFTPLTSVAGLGPRFEDLIFRGVMFSPVPGRSVALLHDGSRMYRVREGETIGNSRVVEIGESRVVLSVESFGTFRQEILELRKREGGGGQ